MAYRAQSRLLRHYMSQTAPSAGLGSLVRYVVCVYVLVVVPIKHRWDVVHGPAHLCETLRRQRVHFKGDELRLLEKNMQRNMFMAHPEGVLAMLGDQDPVNRAEAVELVRAVRQRGCSADKAQIWPHKAPVVNTSAATYTELVDIRALVARGDVLEPPCTTLLADSELASFQQQPLVTGIPLHTQSTERAVKLTT